jgi:Holliday junction DNA helicase RuvB
MVTRHAYLHFGLNIPSRMGERSIPDEPVGDADE